MIQRIPELAGPGSVECPRCSRTLRTRREASLERTLPLAAAALCLYLVANSVPMLGLSAVGKKASTTVLGGALQLWHDGQQLVATLVFLTAVLAPAVQIAFTIAIALGARRDPVPPWVGRLLAYLPGAKVWTMVEVMMLGTLVALIKIADYATVVPGIGLFSLAALIVLLATLQIVFDPGDVWERVRWAGPHDAREPVDPVLSGEPTA